jgi:hypothetical protein
MAARSCSSVTLLRDGCSHSTHLCRRSSSALSELSVPLDVILACFGSHGIRLLWGHISGCSGISNSSPNGHGTVLALRVILNTCSASNLTSTYRIRVSSHIGQCISSDCNSRSCLGHTNGFHDFVVKLRFLHKMLMQNRSPFSTPAENSTSSPCFASTAVPTTWSTFSRSVRSCSRYVVISLGRLIITRSHCGNCRM